MIGSRILLLLVSLGLAGCDASLRQNYIWPFYTSNTFNYAAGGRDLRMEVLGNPTALPQAEFAQAVVDAMQGHNWGQPTNMTLAPDESANTLYRTMVAFNVAPNTGYQDLCRGAVQIVPTVADPIQVRAAFCEGGKTMTAVRGSLPVGVDVYSPFFQTYMAGLTRELFPPYNPEHPRRDECLFFSPMCF